MAFNSHNLAQPANQAGRNNTLFSFGQMVKSITGGLIRYVHMQIEMDLNVAEIYRTYLNGVHECLPWPLLSFHFRTTQEKKGMKTASYVVALLNFQSGVRIIFLKLTVSFQSPISFSWGMSKILLTLTLMTHGHPDVPRPWLDVMLDARYPDIVVRRSSLSFTQFDTVLWETATVHCLC